MKLDFEFLKSGAFLATSGQVWCWSSVGAPSNEGVWIQDYFDQRPERQGFWQAQVLSTASFLEELQYLESTLQNSDQNQQGWSEASFDQFEEQFTFISSRIQQGELIKAVPVAFARRLGEPTQAEMLQWIKNCVLTAKKQNHLYGYGYWQGHKGMVGLTPEVLFEKNKNHITTMALAGTLPLAEKPNRLPLMEDAKERGEHQLVVEDITTQLSLFGSVDRGDTQVLLLPGLEHLKTQIQVESTQVTLSELVQALHPTAALGVWPRHYGLEFLTQFTEQKKRAYFGAPIVFELSQDHAIALVMIRGLMWNRGETLLGAGVGQVAQSQLEREWREILAKQKMVKSLILNSGNAL